MELPSALIGSLGFQRYKTENQETRGSRNLGCCSRKKPHLETMYENLENLETPRKLRLGQLHSDIKIKLH